MRERPTRFRGCCTRLISVAYDLRVADVETGSGRRTIDLDSRTIAVLRSWRNRQLEKRLALGRPRDEGIVFTRPEGTPIHLGPE